MTMRLLSEDDVSRLVTPALAIGAAEMAFAEQAAHGGELLRGRLDLRREPPGSSALVVAGFSTDNLLAVKTNGHCWPVRGGPRIARGLLTLWDMNDAAPVAMISATAFNDHRTAAGFAAAAKILAPRDAATLAVFGAGKLAEPSLRYLPLVRPAIRRILIVGRTPARAETLARRVAALPEFAAIDVSATTDAARTAREADIIVTATTSDSPVFPGTAVRDGTLVILGGANRPGAREADDDLMRRAAIYTDHTAGTLEKAGDLMIPLASGVLAPSQIRGEIGRWVGQPAPRPAAGEVAVFKSIGIALQDLMLARQLLAKARADGVGQLFEHRARAGMETA